MLRVAANRPLNFSRPALRSLSSVDGKAPESKSKLAKDRPPPKEMACFKYFINKSTVLGVYREALQLCSKGFSDPSMRQDMKELMRYEFEPFRKYSGYTQQSEKVQEDIDYCLAKCRQRIN